MTDSLKPGRPDQGVLNYAPPPGNGGAIANWSMILGILAVPLLCVYGLGILVGIVAMVMGLVALQSINANPYQGNKGMAMTGAVLGALTCFVLPLGFLLLPVVGHNGRTLSGRSDCGANITGIIKALNLYAAENADSFPIVQFAPYSPALNNPAGNAVGNVADTLGSYYTASRTNQAGSPTACVWILVVKGYIGPKQFICKSDPTGPTVSDVADTTGNLYSNFQHGSQMSYSLSYPWMGDGTPAGSWRSTVDSSLPIAADMAPLDGTGTPVRNLGQTLASAELSPNFPKNVNSVNHVGGEGQNVGFADTHVEFAKNPYVGQGGDSIWTQGATNVVVRPGPIGVTTTMAPFDTVMVPVRNATTGGM
jgi:hypothetical protein